MIQKKESPCGMQGQSKTILILPQEKQNVKLFEQKNRDML